MDAVSIAVPTSLHADIACWFLERGIPVLVEKPLSDSVRSAERIVEAARKSGTFVGVGHVERFNPVVVAATELGIRPIFIECHRLNPFSFRSTDVGVVLDLMIHDLDVILHFVKSKVERVDAVGVPILSEHEDIANARLTFANGADANVTASRVAIQTMRKIRVFFARNGALIMSVEEDMTLDEINGGIVARYVSATLGWRVYPISSLSQFLPVENAVAPAYIPPAAPPWRTSTGSLVADWASCTDSLNNGAARSTDVDGNGTTRSFVLNVNSSGSSVDLTGFTPFSLADTKNLLIWAKASAGASVERPLRILLSTDPGGAWTTYFEICTSIQGDDQWVPISLVRPHWTSNGGATWGAVVTKIRFRANDSTVTLGYPILAGSHTITVGTMRRNATSRPSVLFSCDDAHLSLQGWGAALATHGWAGAAYHYPRHIGYQTRATVDQLRVLKSLGWLIGNHSYKSPDDLAGNGSRNLGPVGIGISAASFDSSNIVSVATNRAPPTTSGVVSAIKFTAGTLPAELALNTTYWMRGQTASSIKLYNSYDAANEQDAAGLVPFSASATTATWQYVDALNDSTAIREDFERAAEAIRSWGFGDDGLHVALSQSAYDMYVVNALRRFGARSVRSALAYSGSGDAPCAVPAGFAARGNGSTGAPYGSWCTWPGAADFDNLTALHLQAYVDSLVELGGTGHIYSHTTVDTDKLATLAAYIKSIDGLVVTTPDLWITGSTL